MRKFACLALLLTSQTFADPQVKHISASGGYSRNFTGQLLFEVESDAVDELAKACGSIEGVASIGSITVTFETTRAILRPSNTPGKDLFEFANYPASHLEADITCR